MGFNYNMYLIHKTTLSFFLFGPDGINFDFTSDGLVILFNRNLCKENIFSKRKKKSVQKLFILMIHYLWWLRFFHLFTEYSFTKVKVDDHKIHMKK